MSENRKALIVANFDYEDAALRQLTAPPQDAQALASVLKAPDIGGFEVQSLLNETSARVSGAIEEFFRFSNSKPEDLLLFYFSGHGVTDEDGRLYLAAADTRLVGERVRQATAVAAAFVDDVMRGSRSRRQVLLLDCCYSGAFAEAQYAKGDGQSSVARHFQGEGRIVLTASGARQFSLESETGPGPLTSLYTRMLVRGLQTGEADRDGDGWVSVDELHDYLVSRVTAKSPKQTPTKSGFVEGQIYIARSPEVPPAELPPHIQQLIAIDSPAAHETAVHELSKLLYGRHRGLNLAAYQALAALKQDDSLRVRLVVEECVREYEASRPTAYKSRAQSLATPKVEPTPPAAIPVAAAEDQHSGCQDSSNRAKENRAPEDNKDHASRVPPPGWRNTVSEEVAGLQPERETRKRQEAEARYDKCKKLYREGDLPGARAELRRALRLQPDYAEAHNMLGIILRNNQELRGATIEYREAIRLKPNFAEAHYNLGRALKSQSRLEAAIAEYREAIRLKPELAEAHYHLGRALYDRHDWDAAAAEYQETIRLRPDFAPAHTSLALTLKKKGVGQEASREIRGACELSPDNTGVRSSYKKLAAPSKKNAPVTAKISQ